MSTKKSKVPSFKEFHYLKESRWSDSQYRNIYAPWRLTRNEYLIVSNKSFQSHSSEVYEPRPEEKVVGNDNPVISVEIQDSTYKGWKKLCWEHLDGSGGCRDRVSPMEVTDEESAKKFAEGISPRSKLKYKTVTQYHWQDKSSKYNKENYSTKAFPIKIETLKDGTEIRLKRNPQIKTDFSLGAFQNGELIGVAFNEWGATLIQVDPSFRNRGIGRTLSRIFNSIHQRDSGGFTPQGKTMKKAMHSEAVKQAQKMGWYNRALKDGLLTKEKIEEIISSANLPYDEYTPYSDSDIRFAERITHK